MSPNRQCFSFDIPGIHKCGQKPFQDGAHESEGRSGATLRQEPERSCPWNPEPQR